MKEKWTESKFKVIENIYFKWSIDNDLISGYKPESHYINCTFINCDFHPNVYDYVIFDDCTFIGCNIYEDEIITSETLLK